MDHLQHGPGINHWLNSDMFRRGLHTLHHVRARRDDAVKTKTNTQPRSFPVVPVVEVPLLFKSINIKPRCADLSPVLRVLC